jgi:hypothetical protein
VIWADIANKHETFGRILVSVSHMGRYNLLGANVRWRILLPALFAVVSVSLMVLTARQAPMLRGAGTGWEVPARVINALINGLGFGLGALFSLPIPHELDESLGYDGSRLFGIVAFWFLIGLTIDRRRDGRSLDQRHPIFAGVLFAVGALTCGVLGLAVWDNANIRNLNILWVSLTKYPLQTTSSMQLGMSVWLLVFCVYLGKKSFAAARRVLSAAKSTY